MIQAASCHILADKIELFEAEPPRRKTKSTTLARFLGIFAPRERISAVRELGLASDNLRLS